MTDKESESNDTLVKIDNYESLQTVQAEIVTRIPNLQERFFFHELIKQTDNTNHYIIEDVEVDPTTLADPDSPLFYYLKQTKFNSYSEFYNAKKYYGMMLDYCQSPFAKNDIVNLNFVFDFYDQKDSYFELITITDYGEADRIDIENIGDSHINKFLKNVCVLLTELKKFNGLYNANLSLKNILLSGGDLKLGGFKPIYIDKEQTNNWKEELAQDYTVYRLDLYLLGILWLCFLKVDFGKKLNADIPLSTIKTNVMEVCKDLPTGIKINIIKKLVDLDHYPDLSLEEIVLDFDEYYILENIKIEESGNEQQTIEYEILQGIEQETSLSIESESKNPFAKPYLGESVVETQNSKKDDQQTAKMFNSNSNTNRVEGDGINFTLKEKESIVGEDNELIQVTDGKLFDISDEKKRVTAQNTFGYTSEGKDLVTKARHNTLQGDEIKYQLSAETSKNRIRERFKSELMPPDFGLKEGKKMLKQDSLGVIPQNRSEEDHNKDVVNYSYRMNIEEEMKYEAKLQDIIQKNEERIARGETITDNRFSTDQIRFSFGFDSLGPGPQANENGLLSKENSEIRKENKVVIEKNDVVKKSLSSMRYEMNQIEESLISNEESMKDIEMKSQEKQSDNNLETAQIDLYYSEEKEESKVVSKERYNNKDEDIEEEPVVQESIIQEIVDITNEEIKGIGISEVVEEKVKETIAIEPTTEEVKEIQIVKETEKVVKNVKQKEETKQKDVTTRKKSVNKKLTQKNKSLSKERKKKEPTKPKVKRISTERKKVVVTPRKPFNRRTHTVKETPKTITKSREVNKKAVKKSNSTKKQKKEEKRIHFTDRLKPKRNPVSQRSNFVKRELEKEEAKMRLEEERNELKKKELLRLRDLKRQHEEEILNQRIEWKLKEKLEAKEIKKKEEARERSLQRKSERNNSTSNNIKRNTKSTMMNTIKDRSNSRSLSSKRTEKLSFTSKSVNKTNSALSNTNTNFEAITKRMNAEVQFTSIKNKDDFFAFNSGTINKGIGFRKVLEKATKSNKTSKTKKTDSHPRKDESMIEIGKSYSELPGFETQQKEIENSQRIIEVVRERRKERESKRNSKIEEPQPVKEEKKSLDKPKKVKKKRVLQITRKNNRVSDKKAQELEEEEKKQIIEMVSIKIEEAKVEIQRNDHERSAEILEELTENANNAQKIEIYKLLATNYLKLNDFEKSINSNKECVRLIEKSKNLDNKEEMLKSALMGLAIACIQHQDYQGSLDALQHKIYIDTEDYPSNYFSLLGDSYTELGLYSEGYKAYQRQYSLFTANKIGYIASTSLLVLSNKMFICLSKADDDAEMKRLYAETLNLIKHYVYVNEINQNNNSNYQNLQERYLISVINILLYYKNYRFAKFILDDMINRNLVDYNEISDQQKLKFVDFYLNLTVYLKSRLGVEIEKKLYIEFLDESARILDYCSQTDDSLKKELFVYFSKGIYFLQDSKYKKARANFERSLETYHQHVGKPDTELFTILYNIALSLYNLQQYRDCPYYFEKILKLECSDPKITFKSIKMLGKCYYRLGDYEKCRIALGQWIYENLNREKKNAKNFEQYLSIYFIACFHAKSTEFDQVLETMRKELDFDEKPTKVALFNILFNFFNISNKNKNIKQNEAIVKDIERILKRKIDKQFCTAFLTQIERLYSIYVKNKNDNDLGKGEEFIRLLNDSNESIEDNVNNIIRFSSILLFIFMNRISFGHYIKNNEEFRNKLLIDIKGINGSDVLYSHVFNLLSNKLQEKTKKTKRRSTNKILDQKPDRFIMTASEKRLRSTSRSKSKSVSRKTIPIEKTIPQPKKRTVLKKRHHIVSKQEKIHSTLIKANVANKPVKDTPKEKAPKNKRIKAKRGTTLDSFSLLERSNLKKKNKCFCFNQNKKQNKILEYIQEFLKQLKNMLFLDITDKIETYYNEFERIVKEKKLDWEKYIYIKKLFKFYFKNKGLETLNVDKFEMLLDSLLGTSNLCIHDIKMMLVFFESFKDVAYVEAFIYYFDKYHSGIARVIITDMIQENFETKFERIKNELYHKIQTGRFYTIENFPFLHYLNEDNNLILEKEFTFKVYKRVRYLLMSDLNLHEFFIKYVPFEQLIAFYLRYACYTALVSCIRKDTDSFKIIREYKETVDGIMDLKNARFSFCQYFNYDLLLIFHLIRFNSEDDSKIGEFVLEITNKLNKENDKENLYHFILASSLIGNILFKYKLYQQSIEIKRISFERFKEVKSGDITFPSYIREVKAKQLLFDILKYLYMGEMILGKENMADKIYKKILSLDSNNKKNEIGIKCLSALNYMMKSQFKMAADEVKQARKQIEESKMNLMNSSMYMATVEKMALDMEIAGGNQGRIERQRTKARGSIHILYSNLINN